MSENHPSKPIRKAGPTTGELVLDRGLALHLLDQMDVIRRKHSGSLPPPCDYYMRSMEAVIARAADYESRNEWTDALKVDEQSRYFRDLQLVETVVIFNRRKNGLCPHSPFSRKVCLWSTTGTKITGISPDSSPKGHVTGSGYYITGRLLKYKQPYIHTDQTAFLRTELFDMGYRIFLHYANGAVMEIKLGDNPQPGRSTHGLQ